MKSLVPYYIIPTSVLLFHLLGCIVQLDTTPTNPGHIIGVENELIFPILVNNSRVINLPTEKKVTLVCEGKGNFLIETKQQVNEVTCGSSKTFIVEKKEIPYSKFGCKTAVKETVKETGECPLFGVRVEIGWDVKENFVNQITICHNKTTANTFFAADTIFGASMKTNDEEHTRPAFRKGKFYTGIDVDTAYSQVGQTKTVAAIVGSDSLAAKYMNVSKSFYFARGHFAPDADFVDAAGSDATYYYINVAPQWQSFNNGNWKALEMATRNLAIKRARNLNIYTGGFGILTLADVKNVQKPIYLAFDSKENGLIPVPKYYWKVVHDPLTKTATAFVGINNPHLTSILPSDILCEDICNKVSWVTWNRLNIPSGYMFCCTLSNLKNLISYAPDLGNLPLLV